MNFSEVEGMIIPDGKVLQIEQNNTVLWQRVKEASGAVVTFPDGSDVFPIKSLVATLTPIQSGTGTPAPDNVRPITGKTQVTFTQRGENLTDRTYSVTFPALGKNLYNCAEYSSYKQPDDTYRLTGANATSIKVYFPQDLVGKEIVISVYLDLTKETGPSYVRLRAVVDDTNKNGATIYNGNTGYSTVTVTPTSTSDYFYMTYGSNGNNYYTFSQFQVEIKTGSSRTSYEPYTNTVYSGTVDLVSGVLTVNRKTKRISAIEYVLGSPKYIKSDAVDGYINVSEIYPSKGPTGYKAGELMGDRLNFQNKGIWATVGFPNCWTINGIQVHINVANNLIGVTDYTQETTTTARTKLNAWLTSNPVTIVIPIQPITYQLTPQQIYALNNTNTIWNDAGDTKVVYIAKYT